MALAIMRDSDADNDGVINEEDDFPFDPAISKARAISTPELVRAIVLGSSGNQVEDEPSTWEADIINAAESVMI